MQLFWVVMSLVQLGLATVFVVTGNVAAGMACCTTCHVCMVLCYQERSRNDH